MPSDKPIGLSEGIILYRKLLFYVGSALLSRYDRHIPLSVPKLLNLVVLFGPEQPPSENT